MPAKDKVVLAYSGGLDTSVIIPWLRENYGCSVIAMAADVGQKEELHQLEEKALASGAEKLIIRDVVEDFVTDFVLPTLQAGAVYEGKYLLGTAIARPLIARCLVEVARQEGADAVAHGCTGKGNDQVRFELTVKALAPDLGIIAPWREWDIASREDAMTYARERDIPVPVTAEKPYSMDRNLWHISYEGGILEDPYAEPPEDMFLLTADPARAPAEPEYVEIDYVSGVPVAVNGTKMDPVALLELLNQRAGIHGVGRVDIVENRLVGMKSRGVYETPGGTLLYAAHRELEALCLDRETMRFKELVAAKYAELVYYGLWYTRFRECLDALVQESQRHVSGRVRLKLYRGQCLVAGRAAPRSLYHPELATFGADDVYDQSDAEGFINLFGLPLLVEGMVRRESE